MDANQLVVDIELMVQVTLAAVAIVTLPLVFFQTRKTAAQTRINAAAAELDFNLRVMLALQQALKDVARDPASFDYIWGPEANPTPNAMPQQCAHAILDIVSMAAAAVDRLPGFSRNQDDWSSYIEYIMSTSPNLRAELRKNLTWWPELATYLTMAES